jgi:hypothetical protein
MLPPPLGTPPSLHQELHLTITELSVSCANWCGHDPKPFALEKARKIASSGSDTISRKVAKRSWGDYWDSGNTLPFTVIAPAASAGVSYRLQRNQLHLTVEIDYSTEVPRELYDRFLHPGSSAKAGFSAEVVQRLTNRGSSRLWLLPWAEGKMELEHQGDHDQLGLLSSYCAVSGIQIPSDHDWTQLTTRPPRNLFLSLLPLAPGETYAYPSGSVTLGLYPANPAKKATLQHVHARLTHSILLGVDVFPGLDPAPLPFFGNP